MEGILIGIELVLVIGFFFVWQRLDHIIALMENQGEAESETEEPEDTAEQQFQARLKTD